MHILFGKESADELASKYTVLELDTFKLGVDGIDVTAYCAVENIPFDELTNLEQAKTQHEHMLINYRLRNWADCLEGISALKGRWGGELDSFYTDMQFRVETYIKNEPAPDWSHIILKTTS